MELSYFKSRSPNHLKIKSLLRLNSNDQTKKTRTSTNLDNHFKSIRPKFTNYSKLGTKVNSKKRLLEETTGKAPEQSKLALSLCKCMICDAQTKKNKSSQKQDIECMSKFDHSFFKQEIRDKFCKTKKYEMIKSQKGTL